MIKNFTKLKTAFGVLTLVFFSLYSCSKDDKDDTAEIKGVVNSHLESDTTIKLELTFYHPSLYYERGFRFTPLKDGKITHLGVRLNEPGTFLVTIYQASRWSSSSFVCARKEVEQTTYNRWSYEKIEPFEIKKDGNYYITVSIPINVVFNRTREVTFPLKTKNISITNVVLHYYLDEEFYLEGIDGAGVATNYLEGVPDFVFIPE